MVKSKLYEINYINQNLEGKSLGILIINKSFGDSHIRHIWKATDGPMEIV